jgi:fucose permease
LVNRAPAVFYGAFAAGRFLGIFVSLWLKPASILAASFTLSLASVITLCVTAEVSPVWLWCGSLGTGLGMSMVYATALVWVEQHVPVTGTLAAAFTIAGSVGPDVVPLAVGQVIEKYPMAMMYMVLGVLTMCIVIFCVGVRLSEKLNEVDEDGSSNINRATPTLTDEEMEAVETDYSD